MKETGWDSAALVVLGVHALLLLAWWPLLPFFLDSYYHLNVVTGFREAGGVVAHAYWEWAPQGRSHLYPPAFHLLLLSLDFLWLNPLDLARLASVFTYALLMLSTWWAARACCFGAVRSACLLLPLGHALADGCFFGYVGGFGTAA